MFPDFPGVFGFSKICFGFSVNNAQPFLCRRKVTSTRNIHGARLKIFFRSVAGDSEFSSEVTLKRDGTQRNFGNYYFEKSLKIRKIRKYPGNLKKKRFTDFLEKIQKIQEF
jgi:hypothetical protein